MKALKYIFRIVLLLSLNTVFFNCCSDDNDREVHMWIAAEKVIGMEMVSSLERSFLQYKLDESDNWMILSETIVGFKYEEGYEYILLVKSSKVKNPAEDQLPTRYTLLKVISKIKKMP